MTGVAGFIGSHIAERMVLEGHEVIGIDNMSAGHRENIPHGVKFFNRDICNSHEYPFILRGVDAVFHNAASKKNICLRNPVRDMEVNGTGTLSFIQNCIKAGIEKFVHASTGSVYGEIEGLITEDKPRRPISFYGISKTAGESYVMMHRHEINVTALRYFHVWGERQESDPDLGGVVSIFDTNIKRLQPIMIHGDGTQKRVFTHVSDIVEANLMAWLNPSAAGHIYNCASSQQTSINELAEMLMKKNGRMVDVMYSAPLNGDIYSFLVSTEKIKQHLNVTFKPITDLI